MCSRRTNNIFGFWTVDSSVPYEDDQNMHCYSIVVEYQNLPMIASILVMFLKGTNMSRLKMIECSAHRVDFYDKFLPMKREYSFLNQINSSIRKKWAFNIALTRMALLYEVSGKYFEKEDFLKSIFNQQRKHRILSKLWKSLRMLQRINRAPWSESYRMKRFGAQVLLLEKYFSTILYYVRTCP